MPSSSIRLSAMNILALREHSVKELRIKLVKKFNDQLLEIEQLLCQLISDNLLSDDRFTEVFVRSRLGQGFGPVKICYELSSKGVDNDIIEKHMNISDDVWQEILHHTWNKKYLNKKNSTKNKTNEPNRPRHFQEQKQEQVKQSRFLQQRGFSHSQIKTFFNRNK